MREEGNTLFRSAGFAPCAGAQLTRARLLMAEEKYRKSLAASASCVQSAKACKNLAVTAGRMLECCPPDRWTEHARSRLKHSLLAVEHGRISMGENWLEGCADMAQHAFVAALERCGGAAETCRETAALRDTLRSLDLLRTALEGRSSKQAGYMLLGIAEKLFQMGVTLCEGKDYCRAAQVNGEASRPLEEAAAAAKRSVSTRLVADVEQLKHSLFFQRCTCDSFQAREQGSRMLQRALHAEEELSMDAVAGALDCFKEAVLLARELDVESEAIALSMLGKAYDRVLRLRDKAGAYYLRCMQLAASMAPRCFTSEPWYAECRDALQRFQAQAAARDEAARQAEREPFLQELAGVLEELRTKAAAGAHALLKHLYAAHPLPNPAHRLEEEPCADNTKGLLKRAISHYHPDKAAQAQYGPKRTVLHEEVVKLLTAKYEVFK